MADKPTFSAGEALFHLMGPLLLEKLSQSALCREKGQRPGFKSQPCGIATLEGISMKPVALSLSCRILYLSPTHTNGTRVPAHSPHLVLMHSGVVGGTATEFPLHEALDELVCI